MLLAFSEWWRYSFQVVGLGSLGDLGEGTRTRFGTILWPAVEPDRATAEHYIQVGITVNGSEPAGTGPKRLQVKR